MPARKDGAIRHVLSGVNPQGCEVFSFKQPSANELEHDFLWRTPRCLPERGRIGVFNRSYYEEVLVVRILPDNQVSPLSTDLPGQPLPVSHREPPTKAGRFAIFEPIAAHNTGYDHIHHRAPDRQRGSRYGFLTFTGQIQIGG